MWSAFSRPRVTLGIQAKYSVAVVSVNLLVMLVDEYSLFYSCCDYCFLRP